MLLGIDEIKVSDRIRKDFGNIQELAEDIKENGLINPPVVTPDNELIAGERRLKACKSLGYQQIEVRVMSVKDSEHQLQIEISENENRKDFTFTERMDWVKRMERIEIIKAKERMGQGTPTLAEQGEVRDIVADKSGFGSHGTLDKAKFIANNADADLIKQLNEKQITVNKAYQETKKANEQVDDLLTENKRLNKELSKTPEPKEHPEPIEVEVIPDYIQKQIFQLKAQNKGLEGQVKSLLTSPEKERMALESKASMFTGRINLFLRDMGSLTYIGQEVISSTSYTKQEYERSLTQMEKWCREMRLALSALREKPQIIDAEIV